MISIIVCSITPSKLAALRENLSRLLAGEPHEFVSIDDAKSLAEGYNRAIARSRGDIVIACHDDIEILADDFLPLALARLRSFDLLGVAGSTVAAGPAWVNAGPPHIFGQVAHLNAQEPGYIVYVWGAPAPCVPGMQIMDGIFLMGHRRVFEQVRFDEATFDGFHLYDSDFTFSAARAGYKLAVCLDFAVIHLSHGDWSEEWNKYAERFVGKHLGHFANVTPLQWQVMTIKVPNKEDLPRVLRSSQWRGG